MIHMILLIAALVFFILAAISVPIPRINCIGMGLALLTLSFLIH